MEELQKIKIKMEVVNQYGDRFAIEQEVDEEYTDDDGELSVYHNAYLSFIKAAGFSLNYNDRVIVLKEDEVVGKYYEDDICDGDCENCEEYEEEDNDDYNIDTDIDESISDILRNHAKEIADLVAEEFNKSRTNIGWKDYIKSV